MRKTIDSIVEVNKSKQRYDDLVEVEKFNPYHDSRGRFSTSDGAASFTYAPGKSKAHDNAIAREKERHAASAVSPEQRVKDAETKISGLLSDGSTVNLRGMDPDVADSVAQAVEAVISRYPSMKDAFGGFSTAETREKTFAVTDDVMAVYDHQSGVIHLNNKYYGDKSTLDKAYADTVEKNFHPKGTTSDSVIAHEMGHAIDEYVSKKVIDREDFSNGARVSTYILSDNSREAWKAGNSLTSSRISDDLSKYASKDQYEYLAEGFAEFVTSPNPRPLATQIGKSLEKYIKQAE